MEYMEKTLAELREIAKEKGLKGITALRKPELAAKLTEFMAEEEKKNKPEQAAAATEREKRADRMPVRKNVRKSEPSGERSAAGPRKATTERKTVAKRRPAMEDRRVVRERKPMTDRRPEAKTEHRITEHRTTEHRTAEHRPSEYRSSDYRQQDYRQTEYKAQERKTEQHHDLSEQRSDQVSQNSSYHYNYNPNQKYRYHDGSDGLISIVKDRQIADVHPTELKELDSGVTKNGILEIMPEGYGFIRCDNFLPGENDVYVAPQFIRRFGLRTGDMIEGNLRIRTTNEKFSALLYMKEVNGESPSYLYTRNKFEELTPVFPDQRIHLETPGSGVSMRMLDLISPIGKGQRGMIVSQPKTGKTTLLKQVARAVTKNYPKMHLIILLIDERPEEVTDIKESIEGEKVDVIYSTFDELPENHKRVSEMVIERGKRLVEGGEDVIILLDSITRLARAYNLTVTPSGRTLSGGLDPAALHMPKRFFGAARNMREGGSLTILATALVDTGSRMDDVVFEEFKGTGNMELVLDRSLSEKRIFPAIDIQKSSTRREDLLLNKDEQEAVVKIRKALGGMKSEQSMEQILNLFRRTKNNAEFLETVKKMHL